MKKIKGLLLSTIPFLLAFTLEIVAALVLVPFYFLSYLDFSTIASILFSLLCILIFARWYHKRCNGRFKINIREEFHRYELLGILLLIPGTQFLCSIFTGIISIIFPSWLESYLELIESSGLSGDISILMLIYSVLMAPISEELIFRGVTYSIARRSFSFWGANIIQALLFGIFHMNPLQGCYTFFLGLILGYIREKGGTLYHAILFHFLFNLWGTTVSDWMIFENEILQVLVIFGGATIGVFGGLHLFNKEKNNSL